MSALDDLAYYNALAFQELKDGLVRARIKSGLSTSDVSESLGVGISVINHIEDEGSNPQIATLRAYATAIGAKVTVSVEPGSEHQR